MIKNARILSSNIFNEAQFRNTEIIKENYLLITKIANRFFNKSISKDDLISYGVIGLLKACEGFDSKKGVKLSTYAYFYIEKEIQDNFNSFLSNGIMSHYDVKNKNLINKIINEFKQRGIDNPSYEEIAQESKRHLSINHVASILSCNNVISLDYTYLDGDDSYTLADSICAVEDVDMRLENNQYEERLHNKIIEMLSLLDQGEQDAIKVFFNEGECSFNKTAKLLKCTVDRIKKLYYHAISKIRLSNIKSFKEEDRLNNFN